jgi:hypothetical protein
MTLLLTLAGVAIAVGGWEACWRLGDLRDDQELREAGVILGPACASVIVFVMVFALVDVHTIFSTEAATRLKLTLAFNHAVNVLLFGLTVAATLEWAFLEDGRLEHEGLLLAPLLPDGGEES